MFAATDDFLTEKKLFQTVDCQSYVNHLNYLHAQSQKYFLIDFGSRKEKLDP